MKSTRPVPGVSMTSLGRAEVLHAHAHDESIDGGRVVDGIASPLRVVEDVAGVVPEAEVGMADPLDGLATLRARGILAAVRLDAQADALRRREVAALGDRPVIAGVRPRVGRPAEQQVGRAARRAVLDQAAKVLDRPCRRTATAKSPKTEIVFSPRFCTSLPTCSASARVVCGVMMTQVLPLWVMMPA